MKKNSALWGTANSGKTSTLKLVHKMLEEHSSESFPEFKLHDSDLRDIFIINGIKVGIETRGDPNSRLKSSLELFKKSECNYIICASRSRGSTVDLVNSLKPQYHVCWRAQSSVSDSEFSNQSNEAIAKLLFEEFMVFVNA